MVTPPVRSCTATAFVALFAPPPHDLRPGQDPKAREAIAAALPALQVAGHIEGGRDDHALPGDLAAEPGREPGSVADGPRREVCVVGRRSRGGRGRPLVRRSAPSSWRGVPGPLAVHMTVRWQHLVDARMRSVLRGVPGVQASTQEEGSRPRCLPSLPATTAAVQPPRMAFSYTVRRMFVSQTASQTIFRANSGRCSCNGVPLKAGQPVGMRSVWP